MVGEWVRMGDSDADRVGLGGVGGYTTSYG